MDITGTMGFPGGIKRCTFDADLPGGKVRTTLNLDDNLINEAKKLTGIEERTALIHDGLRALIARESARRLARLGGTDPKVAPIPRRRLRSA